MCVLWLSSDDHPGMVKARQWTCWHWKETSLWVEAQRRTWQSWSPCSSADWRRGLGMLWPWGKPTDEVRLIFLSYTVTAERSLLESFMLIALWVVFHSSTDDPTFLSFRKGELIIIIKDDEFSQQHGWIKGQNERTGQEGAVPTDAIFILPTLSEPTNEVMVWRCHWHILLRWVVVARMCGVLNVLHVCLFQRLLNLSPNQRKSIIQANQRETGTAERSAPATLKEFSLEYFRYQELSSFCLHSKHFFTSWTAGKRPLEQHWQQEYPSFFPLMLQGAHQGCEPSGDVQERCSWEAVGQLQRANQTAPPQETGGQLRPQPQSLSGLHWYPPELHKNQCTFLAQRLNLWIYYLSISRV